jgi:(-)-germacrene D synthase
MLLVSNADVFLKFRDDKGDIVTNDARCLLRMYEAAHVRVNGEEILDNILIHTKRQLQCIVDDLEPTLQEEVRYALETPLFRRLNRVQARQFISTYEKSTTRNNMLLEFSKLDFNILLTLYCEELKDLTL